MHVWLGGLLTSKREICGLGRVQCPPLIVQLFSSWSFGQERINLQLLYPGGCPSASCLKTRDQNHPLHCKCGVLTTGPPGEFLVPYLLAPILFKRPGFNFWVGKSPWRRQWQPPPVFLPRESHGQRSLAVYSH